MFSMTLPPGLRAVAVAYLVSTVGFQYMANLPIEKELYLGVAARFWMQSDVASGFMMGVAAWLVIGWVVRHVDGGGGVERTVRKGGSGGGGGGSGRRGKGGRGGKGREVEEEKGGSGANGGGGEGSGGLAGAGGGGGSGYGGGGRTEVAALAVILALLAARVSTNFGAVDERHNRMFEVGRCRLTLSNPR